MQLDDVLKKIGEFGRYQKIAFILYGASSIPCAWQAVLIVFTGAQTTFRCGLSFNESVWTESCNTSIVGEKCDEFVYNRSEFVNTIRTEWNLVCDRDYLVALVQTFFMAGWLVGSTVSGYISDRFGRRKTLLLCSFSMVIASVGAAYLTNYLAFVVLRFVTGAMTGATYTGTFVLVIEMTGMKRRSMVGIGLNIFFGFGISCSAGLAYVIRDHRHLQLVVGLVMIVSLIFYWIMPESPRWLIIANRKSEAKVILKKMARVNGGDFDSDTLYIEADQETTDRDPVHSVKLLDLVRTPNLRRVSCVIAFYWCVVSLVYYGITLSGASFGSSLFLNMFLFGVVEILGCSLACIASSRLGRVKILVACNTIGGLCCLAGSTMIGNADLNWLLVAVVMCGRCAISASFSTVYLYTLEIYPTIMRNLGLGVASMWARLGGLVAPQIARIGYVWSLLPFMVFAIIAIAAALLALLLPETRGKTLPETAAQGEAFAKTAIPKCGKRSAHHKLSVRHPSVDGEENL